MVGLETDLGLVQGVDEMAVLLDGNVAVEPALDGGHETGELGLVLVPVPGAVDGGGEFVQQLLQIVFHVSTLSLPTRALRRRLGSSPSGGALRGIAGARRLA